MTCRGTRSASVAATATASGTTWLVINFLNRANAADRRVFELLSEKFRLFSGVFGVSDEVLGSIESGVDFEKRVAEIYQKCRTSEDIQASFDALQESLSAQISAGLAAARQKLLENFDGEVAEKLHVYEARSNTALDRFGALFWQVTQWGGDGGVTRPGCAAPARAVYGRP